jgi:predicted RNase H-like HicB family nuclease
LKKEDTLANIREAIELYMEPVEDDIMLSPGRGTAEIVI